MKKLDRIISKAKREGRIRAGLVLCENCENPASKDLSLSLSWTACAPCVWGEADSFDAGDLIAVPDPIERAVDLHGGLRDAPASVRKARKA